MFMLVTIISHIIFQVQITIVTYLMILCQKSAQIIASEYLKNYDQFNKKHQIQYIRQGTKDHYFSRASFDDKENIEILKIQYLI